VRIPDGIADGPHLDPRRGHVQQEVRNAFALGRIRVGAGKQQAPVGVLTAAGPQLLAVYDVRVASAPCRGTKAGKVGTGLRFGEPLDPYLAVEDRRKVPAALFIGARGEQGRRGVVDADESQHKPRCVVGGQLLVQHNLLGNRHLPFCSSRAQSTAPFGGPVRHRVSGAVQFGEPGLLEADELLVADAGL
jgi:hypothetical protein